MIHLKDVTKVYPTNGASVTLDPDSAPSRYDNSNIITAPLLPILDTTNLF